MANWQAGGRGAAFWVLAAGLLVAPTAAAEDLLRWRFVAGEKLSLTAVQAQLVQGTADTVKIVSQSQSVLVVQWAVEAVDADGNARITATFERLAIELSGPPAVRFDTASKEPPTDATRELDAAIRPLVGTRFELQVSPRGEFLAARTPAASESALRRAAVLGRLGPIFTIRGATRLWRQVLPLLPDKAVAADARWSDAYTTTTPLGELKTTLDLTYLGAAPEAAAGHVAVRIVPKVTFADGSLESTTRTLEGGEKVESRTKIVADEARGTLVFHAGEGRPVQTEVEQILAVETVRGGQTIKTELRTATRMTCRKL